MTDFSFTKEQIMEECGLGDSLTNYGNHLHKLVDALERPERTDDFLNALEEICMLDEQGYETFGITEIEL